MEVFLVLHDFDQQEYFDDSGAQKKFTARHLPETLLSKYSPQIVIEKNVWETIRAHQADGSFVQRSPILANPANRRVRQLPWLQPLTAGTVIAIRGVCGTPHRHSRERNCEGGTILRRLDCGAESRMEESAAIDQG
jgi:hypothetical protein